MFKKILSVIMILMLILSSFGFTFADGKGECNTIRYTVEEIDEDSDDEDNDDEDDDDEDSDDEDNDDEDNDDEDDDDEDDDDEDSDDEDNDDEDDDDEDDDDEDSDDENEDKDVEEVELEDEESEDSQKERNKIKSELEAKKDELESQKDEAEKLKDELEDQYEEAKENGDEELAAQLKEELGVAWEQFKSLKKEMHDVILEKKELIRGKYSITEIEDIEDAEEAITELYPETKVLPVDSIISDSADFKFDTPPVIKDGRTLVPARAITEGFGAKVDWNSETREAIITKGEIEIVLPLDTNKATVNGEEIELDAKSGVMNNRTYVPLRFILETFGMELNWNSETETIEIEDNTEKNVNPETKQTIQE